MSKKVSKPLGPGEVQVLYGLNRATTLGGRVRSLRRFYGLSMNQLADSTGLSVSIIWRLENDDYAHGPRVTTVERVADALSVATHELLGGGS
jgi:transcriptional regulator with XRE-family HTH domain